jgi:hypothetical protein
MADFCTFRPGEGLSNADGQGGPMSPVKTTIALIILTIVSMRTAEASKAADGTKSTDLDPMGVMLEVQASRYSSSDDRMSEKAARTKAFESWASDFSKGDLKMAEKHWGEVITQLKGMGCGDCSRLCSIANERTLMLETKAGGASLLQHMLAATEHKLGPHDRFTATCCKYVARQLEGERKYASAVNYRKRQLSILEETLDKDSQEVLDAKKCVQRDTVAINAQKQKTR